VTAITSARPLTVGDVARTYAHDRNSRRLDDHIAAAVRTAPVPAPTRRSIQAQVHAAIDASLQGDVVRVLTAAWQGSRAFTEAARATAGDLGERRIVELASQTVRHTACPSVTVDINGWRAVTLTLSVTVAITLRDLAAAIAGGAVVGIEFGGCDITVTVRSGHGLTLLERTAAVPADAGLTLLRPVPLA
jgi:hypothetical protein